MPDQLGNLEAMTPGLIDVRNFAKKINCGRILTHNLLTQKRSFLSCKNIYSFWAIVLLPPLLLKVTSTFFLKASSHAMVEYNSARSPSYW